MDLKNITKDIVDAAVKLHMKIGPGLLESVYETILAAELQRRGHTVERQREISFDYDGLHFDKGFRIDFLVDDSVIVELKSTEKMSPVYAKQLKTYLVLTQKTVGLVLNFGMARMTEGIVRIVNHYAEDTAPQSQNLCVTADRISRRGAETQSGVGEVDEGRTLKDPSQNLCASASLREPETTPASHLCASASLRETDKELF